MYKLERTQRVKIILGVGTFLSLLFAVLGYRYGGENLMVIALVAALFSGILYLIINAIQKDVEEQLKNLDNRF